MNEVGGFGLGRRLYRGKKMVAVAIISSVWVWVWVLKFNPN
jgi:hypothetical protein